jgi:chitin disaccharide deacetylase
MTKYPIANLQSLILHADDFGMNRAVTDGILEGFRRGVLTSSSLLTNAPDAARALGLWKELIADHAAGKLPSRTVRRELSDPSEAFDLGVHLNLTLGGPLTRGYPAELLDTAGRFPGVFALFCRLRRHPEKYAPAIREELCRQIEFPCDHGLKPTHLNGHQYIEMMPAIARLLAELLPRYGIGVVRVAEEPRLWRSTVLMGYSPARWLLACVKKGFARRFRREMARLPVGHPKVFFGTAHAGRIDLPLMRRFLENHTAGQTMEIGLHPGMAEEENMVQKEDAWFDPLAKCRPQELQLLTSSELADYLQQRHFLLGRLSLL